MLVSEDEEKSIAKLVLVEHSLELLAGLGYTLSIVRVDDKDDTLSVLKVCMRGCQRVTGKEKGKTDKQIRRSPHVIVQDSQCLQRGRILSCPPTSHTVKEMFLYSTVSTLKPTGVRDVEKISE